MFRFLLRIKSAFIYLITAAYNLSCRFFRFIGSIITNPAIPSLVTAFATVVLAYFTYQYINVTKDMAIKTADMAKATREYTKFSKEQFKIRAYPSFFVSFGKLQVSDGRLNELYQITNKGEITAHKVNSFNVYVYGDQLDKVNFIIETLIFYKGMDQGNSFNVPCQYPPNMSRNWTTGGPPLTSKGENLKYLIMFIKFKVPYDKKLRYETFTYSLKHGPKGNDKLEKLWVETSYELRHDLVSKFLQLRDTFPIDIKAFFRDYVTP